MTQQNSTSPSLDASAVPAEVSAFRFKPTALLLTCALLVVSSVAWRKGVYFSGGADTVVLVKATLTILALALAWLMPRAPGAWSRFRAAPVLWLGVYLTISVAGGFLNGDGIASLVLAVRLAVLAGAIVLIVVSHGWEAVVSALASAMVLLAAFASVTGYSTLAETGRLYGGIPQLNANEICLLTSFPVALLFWKCVHAKARQLDYVALLPLLGVVWLTGARTGLAALVIALLVILLLARRIPTLVVVGIAALVPTIVYLTYLTPVVSRFAGRGDPGGVTTLNSRTIAWRAALQYGETPAEKLLGSGLALKQIPVTAMYRSQQILDSTWISALIQVGIIGLIVLALFVLSTLKHALGLTQSARALVFSLLLMVILVSLLESGMFDTAPSFIIFFTMSMFAHRVNASEQRMNNLSQYPWNTSSMASRTSARRFRLL